MGVFSEIGLRSFSLTARSEPLRSDSSDSIRDIVLWISSPFHFQTWSDMMRSVQTGQTAIQHLYGKAPFEFFEDSPKVSAIFNAGMTGISNITVPAVLEAYDFSGIDTLMDVAGGHGFVLTSILQRYPKMRGVVYELNHVAEGARERIRNLDLTERCEVLSGNFFESIPPRCDVFLMQQIIHDWQDEQAIQILRNVRQAISANPRGRLLLLEGVIAPGNESDATKFTDLEMLMLAGGRERSEDEFSRLLGDGGFRLNRVVKTRASICVLEAFPV